ncbi:MAG: TetR/AcrR family transcriptional regulator [Acidimicrobiales bacterium]|nr:TetR/AcrR family transcriptional regulator [Acidimicrobiales bacterium]
MASHQERRAETRTRLLEAAATLFAERGIEASSIDAIAELAGRTSGAVYDHFGGKEGLLQALLESWVDDVAAAIGSALADATTLDERLLALWRNVANPPSGDGRWIALEHELWTYAVRHPEARNYLTRRYRGAWAGVERAVTSWLGERESPAAIEADDLSGVGPAVIGLLMGLEMMRRIDPSAVSDDLAVAALRGVVLKTLGSRTEVATG